jgi:hypothetical protein
MEWHTPCLLVLGGQLTLKTSSRLQSPMALNSSEDLNLVAAQPVYLLKTYSGTGIAQENFTHQRAEDQRLVSSQPLSKIGLGQKS